MVGGGSLGSGRGKGKLGNGALALTSFFLGLSLLICAGGGGTCACEFLPAPRARGSHSCRCFSSVPIWPEVSPLSHRQPLPGTQPKVRANLMRGVHLNQSLATPIATALWEQAEGSLRWRVGTRDTAWSHYPGHLPVLSPRLASRESLHLQLLLSLTRKTLPQPPVLLAVACLCYD